MKFNENLQRTFSCDAKIAHELAELCWFKDWQTCVDFVKQNFAANETCADKIVQSFYESNVRMDGKIHLPGEYENSDVMLRFDGKTLHINIKSKFYVCSNQKLHPNGGYPIVDYYVVTPGSVIPDSAVVCSEFNCEKYDAVAEWLNDFNAMNLADISEQLTKPCPFIWL